MGRAGQGDRRGRRRASSPSDELAAELIALLPERIGRYKCPRSVDFRDHLPRTDAGKIYKRLLRDEYWATAERKCDGTRWLTGER